MLVVLRDDELNTNTLNSAFYRRREHQELNVQARAGSVDMCHFRGGSEFHGCPKLDDDRSEVGAICEGDRRFKELQRSCRMQWQLLHLWLSHQCPKLQTQQYQAGQFH